MVDADTPSTSVPALGPRRGEYAFEHPLLRVAVDLGEASKTYRSFRRLIRQALACPKGSPMRTQFALSVLDQVEELGLEKQSVLRFKSEWLGEMATTCSSPQLFEAQAVTELALMGIVFPERVWDFRDGVVSQLRLPLLDVTSVQGNTPRALRIPSEVARTLFRCVELALEADRTEALNTWTSEDCRAGIRAIAMLACNQALHSSIRSETTREQFFLNVGSGLWSRITRRLSELPKDERSSLYGDGRLMQAVAMHALGAARLAELRSGRSQDAGLTAPEPGPEEENLANGVKVIPGVIPEAFNKEDKEVLRQYEPLQSLVPIARTPSLTRVETILETLSGEFPWASAVVDEVASMLKTRCLLGVQVLHLSPVLLVGAPGCGKTRFVRRLAELLGLPFMPIPLGGVHDSKPFTGTSRGWASGEPSPLLHLMLRNRSASAVVLLDELDKTSGHSVSSAPVSHVLLGLLEPESAKRWRDNFLQTECDLSRLCFWGTANTLGSVPRPLLSRFSVIHMPSPRPEDMATLVAGISSDLGREWGLPPGVLPTLPAEVYQGTGLNARELRRLITRYLMDWSWDNLRPGRLH